MADAVTLAKLLVELGVDPSEFISGFDKAKKATNAWTDSLQQAGSSMATVGAALSAGVTAPLVALGVAAVKMSEQMNVARIGFTTMLGSAEAAGEFLQKLRDFAKQTPFEFPELVTSAQRLMAMGFAAEEVIPTLTAVGNAAAAMGSGQVGIDRITYALAQMRASVKVSQQDMNQLVQQGINGWDLLAKHFGKTIQEVKQMNEKGMLAGSEAAKAIAEELGKKFPNMMQNMMNSLSGLWSNFKDQISETLTKLGDAIVPIFKALLTNVMTPLMEAVNKVVDAFSKLDPAQQKVVVGLLALAAAAGPVLLALGGAIIAITTLSGAIGTMVTVTLPLAPLFLAIGAALAVLATAAWLNRDALGALASEGLQAIVDIGAGVVAVAKEIGAAFDTAAAWAALFGDNLTANVAPSLPPIQQALKNIYDTVDQFGVLSGILEGLKDGFTGWLTGGIVPVLEKLRELGAESQKIDFEKSVGDARDIWKGVDDAALKTNESLKKMQETMDMMSKEGWEPPDLKPVAETASQIKDRVKAMQQGWEEAAQQTRLFTQEVAQAGAEMQRIVPLGAMMSGLMPPEVVKSQHDYNNSLGETIQKLAAEKAAKEKLKKIADELLKRGIIDQKKYAEMVGATTTKTTDWSQALQDVKNTFDVLGISAQSTIGRIIGGLTSAMNVLTKMASAGKGLGSAMGNIFKGLTGKDASGAAGKGALGFAANFIPALGAALTVAKSAFAIGKALYGLFTKSPVEKAAESAGKALGVKVSQGLAEAIAKTAKEKGIGMFEASLLHIGAAMKESGKDARTFGAAIGDLMNAVKLGAVPATEGIAALGDAFTQVADAAMKAGSVGDKALVDIIRRARELGLEIPEIAQFIGEQLANAIQGVEKMVKGIKITSPADAAAQASIFAATFWAKVKEDGLIAAADAMKPAFDALMEQLKKLKIDPIDEAVFADVIAAMNLATNELFRGAAEGAAGLNQALQGLANSGYLTAQSFAAFGQQADAAFKQAMAGAMQEGVPATEAQRQALLAIAPLLQSIQSAAANYGLEIDATTQNLIDMAKQSGIAFQQDPILQLRDSIDALTTALGGVPPKINDIGRAIRNLPPMPGVPGGGNKPTGSPGAGAQHGGVIPFTGKVMLHGNPKEPEYVLNQGQFAALFRSGGSGARNAYNIAVDARGSTDPRAIEAAAQRGVSMALNRRTNPDLLTSIREAGE